MLELNETIKKSHVAVYPVVFLFFDRGRQGGVFKVRKTDHFLMFLAV